MISLAIVISIRSAILSTWSSTRVEHFSFPTPLCLSWDKGHRAQLVPTPLVPLPLPTIIISFRFFLFSHIHSSTSSLTSSSLSTSKQIKTLRALARSSDSDSLFPETLPLPNLLSLSTTKGLSQPQNNHSTSKW